jgi:hypothetical protein
MPSTDRNLELKSKTSMAQTASQAAVYAKGLMLLLLLIHLLLFFLYAEDLFALVCLSIVSLVVLGFSSPWEFTCW